MSKLLVNGVMYATEREYEPLSCTGCIAFGDPKLGQLCASNICADRVVWTVAEEQPTEPAEPKLLTEGQPSVAVGQLKSVQQLRRTLERAISAVQYLMDITDYDKKANEALIADLTDELEKLK